LVLITGIVWAKATKTPIAGTMSAGGVGSPESYWIDEDGIEHYRGLTVVLDFLSGDLEGTGSGAVSINLDPLTGDGEIFGPSILDVAWEGKTGTFEGHISETITGWWLVGQGVGHGTGDFEGLKMQMAWSGWFYLPDRDWEATILDPQGE
jgi:hypothetical protein